MELHVFIMKSSVVDRHRFDADPDPTFSFDTGLSGLYPNTFHSLQSDF